MDNERTAGVAPSERWFRNANRERTSSTLAACDYLAPDQMTLHFGDAGPAAISRRSSHSGLLRRIRRVVVDLFDLDRSVSGLPGFPVTPLRFVSVAVRAAGHFRRIGVLKDVEWLVAVRTVLASEKRRQVVSHSVRP